MSEFINNNQKRLTRRRLMASSAAAVGGSSLLLQQLAAQQPHTAGDAASHQTIDPAQTYAPGEPGRDYTPVVTPNGVTLPFKIVDGVKVFHLVAEVLQHEICPGLVITAWGYNGRTPGPTIEVVEGDRVRFYVTNHLPEATTVHWHGLILPNGMDGVGGLTQKPIGVGETYKYEFTIRQHGTLMYHPHFDEMTQIALGMMGMFIIHPRNPQRPRPDRDFAIMLSEWAIDPGTGRPDPLEMTDFNVLTMNSRAFPGTEPLVVGRNQRTRIRLGNLSPMDHHPIHLHGHNFKVIETDGGMIPEAGQWPEDTVLVPVGSTRTIEFIAHNPGDWVMHCHMTHHMMNQMGHDIPNMVGVDSEGLDAKIQKVLPAYMTMGQTGMGLMAEHMEHMGVPRNSIPMKGAPGPFAYIDMGGMFTILKVREGLQSYEDPGWYQHPAGTVASLATDTDLRRDGITIPAPKQIQKHPAPAHHDHAAQSAPTTPTVYTCPHHPEVTSSIPGQCPKCRMQLTPK